MKGLIPQEIIDEIDDRIDIVSIINQYVPLKRKGSNYQGLCPFHHEKTPSFTVSPDKKIFHCFGCGVGGNVFTFLMEMENLAFPEAVRKLGPIAGVSIPERDLSQGERKLRDRKKRLLEINDLATKFFQKVLLDSKWGKKALRYLKDRKIAPQTIEEFRLGYSLPHWDGLLNFMQKRGISDAELLDLGLISSKKTGSGYFDRFRDRLMFPIADVSGNIVAFGARVLDDSLPKYLNSPDTPIYNKGQHLYGLNLAKSSIRRKDLSIVVEGYMDVLTCKQYGIDNIVASLGTALTQEQARLLLRYSYRSAISYDADSAGSLATLRGLDILSDLGSEVRVVNLPLGLDPDDYLKANGKEGFLKLVNNSKGLIEYKLDKAIENGDNQTIHGKTRIVQDILPDILKIDSFVAQQSAMELSSEKLGLTFQTIASEMKRFSKNKDKNNSIRKEEKQDEIKVSFDGLNKIEIQVLKLILEKNFLFEKVEEAGGEDLFSSRLRDVYKKTREVFEKKGEVMGNELSGEEGILLSHIIMQDFVIEDVDKAIKDYLQILKINYLDKEYDALQAKLKEAEKESDLESIKLLLLEIENILQLKRSFIP